MTIKEVQKKYGTIEREEIVAIMEKELKKLRDFSIVCSDWEGSCMISNSMLEIAKYLTYEQEW